jgi:gamma-glutamylcyclotransferase (GGCT)/AIG2-like uncharacterized protein YtfP
LTDTSLSLFTYGTLQVPEVMHAVTGKSFPTIDAVLNGYRRYAVRNEVYPAIIAEAGASVCGRLYTGLDQSSINLLDDFEDQIYSRCERDVTTRENIIKAQVYVLSDQYRDILSQEPWELEHFTHEYLDKYLKACKKFFRNHENRQ